MAHWPIGPVCQTCYTAILRSPAECARCHSAQALIARNYDGAGVCGPCAGHDVDYTCRQCGRAGNPYGNGRCAYCVLADKVADLLTGPDGTVSAQLQPLVDAFTQVRLPFTAIGWIRHSPNAKLLARLVANGRPLSHSLLDEQPPTRGLHYIRQIMMQTSVLSQRHEDLERVPSWLEHHPPTSQSRTRTSSARSCIGSSCGEPATAHPYVATRSRSAGIYAAASWSPWNCSPGSTNKRSC